MKSTRKARCNLSLRPLEHQPIISNKFFCNASHRFLKLNGNLLICCDNMFILCSRHNPKILWVDDEEIIGHRIAESSLVLGDFVAQEIEIASANYPHMEEHLLCVKFLCIRIHNARWA